MVKSEKVVVTQQKNMNENASVNQITSIIDESLRVDEHYNNSNY